MEHTALTPRVYLVKAYQFKKFSSIRHRIPVPIKKCLLLKLPNNLMKVETKNIVQYLPFIPLCAFVWLQITSVSFFLETWPSCNKIHSLKSIRTSRPIQEVLNTLLQIVHVPYPSDLVCEKSGQKLSHYNYT